MSFRHKKKKNQLKQHLAQGDFSGHDPHQGPLFHVVHPVSPCAGSCCYSVHSSVLALAMSALNRKYLPLGFIKSDMSSSLYTSAKK